MYLPPLWNLSYFQTLCPNADTMAAAQVAKKLKDKRQQRTIEGIFKKVKRIVQLN